MLWRRANGKDVLIAVIASFIIAGILKYLEFGPLADSTTAFAGFIKPFANQGLIVWACAMIITAVSALITPPPPAEQVSDDLTFNWSKVLNVNSAGVAWYKNVTFWWAVSFVIMIALVLIFSIFVI
jgi:solute:Na+ symporter, SSS family